MSTENSAIVVWMYFDETVFLICIIQLRGNLIKYVMYKISPYQNIVTKFQSVSIKFKILRSRYYWPP